MEDPATFTRPPVRRNKDTGKPEMAGAEALPWAIETLDIGGEIRGRYIRLQAWVRKILGERPAAPDSR